MMAAIGARIARNLPLWKNVYIALSTHEDDRTGNIMVVTPNYVQLCAVRQILITMPPARNILVETRE
jgi:hypothetical protein